MLILALSLLLLVVFFDARFLKKEDERLFTENFYLRNAYLALLAFFIVLVLILAQEKAQALAIVVFFVFLPYYLIKRFKFVAALGQRQQRFHLAADAFGVVLMWILGGGIISTLVGVYFESVLDFDSLLGEMIFSAVGSSILLLVLVYEASRRFSDKGFFYNVGFIRGPNGFLKLFVLPSLAGLGFAVLSVFIVFAREITPSTPLGEIISETQSSYILLVFLLMAVGVAPLVEEIIFRGYLFHVLRQLKGSKFTIIVISLSFAVLHVGQYWGDWLALVMIALIGFTLTLMRAWTRSTIASCVMHYVYNAAVTFIPAIMMMVSNPAYVRYQANFDQLNFVQKVELLHQAIEKEPDLADAHHELAHLYLEENQNIDAALEAINEALSYFPDDKIFLDTKAAVLEKLGRYREALPIRQKLLQNRENR